MSVGEEKSFGKITRESFSAMAAECGLSPKLVLARLDAMATKILPAARKLADELDSLWPSEVYEKIMAVIGRQIAAAGNL